MLLYVFLIIISKYNQHGLNINTYIYSCVFSAVKLVDILSKYAISKSHMNILADS